MSEMRPADTFTTQDIPQRTASSSRDLSKGWLGKTLAGTVCGLAIALITSAFFMLPDTHNNTVYDKYQIAMWMVPPVWLAVLSCCYLFRNALRAWLWLGGVSIAGFALFTGLAR